MTQETPENWDRESNSIRTNYNGVDSIASERVKRFDIVRRDSEGQRVVATGVLLPSGRAVVERRDSDSLVIEHGDDALDRIGQAKRERVEFVDPALGDVDE